MTMFCLEEMKRGDAGSSSQAGRHAACACKSTQKKRKHASVGRGKCTASRKMRAGKMRMEARMLGFSLNKIKLRKPTRHNMNKTVTFVDANLRQTSINSSKTIYYLT
jgi:hypothetical protein